MLLILIWTIGIFSEFLISVNIVYSLAVLPFNAMSSLVCHQDPAKLIEFDGAHSLVCSRCAGIYLGALFMSLLFLFRQSITHLDYKFLLAASVPMILDVFLYTIGIYPYSKIAAFATGVLLGSMGFLYLKIGLENYFVELKNRPLLN